MFTEPQISEREAQYYAGIRTIVPMRELPIVIPQLLDETMGWLTKQGLTPNGAPFIRYHVIDMETHMDIELGWPVAGALAGNGRVAGGVLPAGRYAALIYTGIENGYQGNAALLDWGAKQGLVWDTWESEHGDGFGARVEFFLTDPEDEPDMTKWQTEVAIRLAD